MHLAELTPGNLAAAIALNVRDHQRDLVAPVVTSLAEAYVHRDRAWPRLIHDGDEPVGFVRAYLDWPAPSSCELRSGLWRLNIAGEAGEGVRAVCGGGGLAASPSGPEPFYRKLGFHPNGETLHGQTMGVRDL